MNACPSLKQMIKAGQVPVPKRWAGYAGDDADYFATALVPFGPEKFVEMASQPHSYYLTRAQVHRAYKAISFANFQGAVLNVELTNNWTKMGYVYGQEIDAAFELYKESLRKFLWRHGVKFCHCAVFEHSREHGTHSHELLNVPPELMPEFKRWLGRRIRRLNIAGALKVHDSDLTSVSKPERQWRYFNYMMKGLEPGLMDCESQYYPAGKSLNKILGLQERPPNVVWVERIRLSQDILDKAQKEAGYQPEVNLFNPADDRRFTDYEYRRGWEQRNPRRVNAFGSLFGSPFD